MSKFSANNILILLISILTININGQMFSIEKGWIDSAGIKIDCMDCDSTMSSASDVARYIKDGKWEFYKNSTKTFHTTNYNYLSHFTDGLAVAKEKENWKIIREDLTEVARIKCHFAYGFSEGLARFQLGNRFGFVNAKGEVVLAAKYYGAYDFSNGLARVYDGKNWGYINANFEVVIPFGFDFSTDFSENMAVVGKVENGQEKWAVIDKKGKLIYNWSLDYIFPFSEGKALIRKGSYANGELKYINTLGSFILSTSLKDCYSFKNGLACGYYDGKWGFFDEKGMVVIKPRYDNPSTFDCGLALVNENGVKKYINRTGDVVWSEK